MRKSLSIILSIVLALALFSSCANKTLPSSSADTTGTTSSTGVSDTESTSPDDLGDETTSDVSDDTSNNTTEEVSKGSGNSVSYKTIVTDKITVPGTENWSTAEDAFTLSVSNETIGKFNYYSWYVDPAKLYRYKDMTAEEKKLFNKMAFEDQKVNTINIMVQMANYYYPGKGCDISNFIENWGIGQGSFIDEIIKRKIPILVTIDSIPEAWRGENGENLKEIYADEFSKVMANLIYDLRVECGLNVLYTSLDDEPDLVDIEIREVATLNHYRYVLPRLRKELDNRGMKNVMITGMELCNARNATYLPLKYSEIKDNLYAFTFHDANNGNMQISLMHQKLFYNLPMFQTSTCPVNNETLAGDYLTVNSKGQDVVSDYYQAMLMTSSLINEVNMGINGLTAWQPMHTVSSLIELDSAATNFTQFYYNTDMFDNGFCTTATYDYYTQILNTVSPGAQIYFCSNDVDGEMQGAFSASYLNASAGVNADGTWGINIFNKTDSTYTVGKSIKALDGMKITVNLDVVGLYGTGTQEFDIYATNPQGNANEKVGTMALVDGRGCVEVYPSEVISLRSVSKKIGLNNKPTPIQEVIKDLNILVGDKSYALLNGKKSQLKATPKLTSDFSGVLLTAADFATLLDAKYKLNDKTATITTDKATMTIQAGSAVVEYKGEIEGSFVLAKNAYIEKGNLYFELSDSFAASIGSIFGIEFKQYPMTGLIVAGKHDVQNIGRFAKLFS